MGQEHHKTMIQMWPSPNGRVFNVGSNPAIVWNFPVDLTFQATNAFGWPKMHFSVYGLDFLGTDVVLGYGFTHIPCSAGRFKLKVHLFKPKTQTGMTGFQSWILRRPAEFKQPDFVCQSEGREGSLSEFVACGQGCIIILPTIYVRFSLCRTRGRVCHGVS